MNLNKIKAKAIYICDENTGDIIAEKNIKKRLHIGSIVKLALALMVIKSGKNLNEAITIPKRMSKKLEEIEEENAWNVGLMSGDTLTRMELLELSLISSACDASAILADDISNGNIPVFLKSMNDYMKYIGLKNTNFISVYGINETEIPDSTAEDVMTLMRTFYKEPLFRQISSKTECVQPITNEKYYHTNYMIHNFTEYFRPYIVCSKTGSTTKAGMCLCLMAQYNEKLISVVVLGTPYNVGDDDIPQIYKELSIVLDEIIEWK